MQDYDPLNDGKSSLSVVQVCADDLMVVNAARVSFGTKSDAMDAKEIGIVNYLMRCRHGSPFEHNMFTFYVRCPIFVAREWFRHRIGSFNEYSARYKEMKPDFFFTPPESFRKRVGKPGHYTYEQIEDEDVIKFSQECQLEAARSAWGSYQQQLGQGVAMEVARNVLPVNIYTEFYWTVNARALMNFLSLRNHEAALKEIRLYAECVEMLFGEAMPVTAGAFVENDRVAP